MKHVRNNELGVSSDDLLKCHDLNEVIRWMDFVEQDILSIQNRITDLKSIKNPDEADADRLKKTIYYLECQNIFFKQIEMRVKQLKRRAPYHDFHQVALDFLNPEVYEMILNKAGGLKTNIL